MSLYVTVSRGPRADAAEPIVASSDRRVVGAVLQALARLDEWGDEEDATDVARRLLAEEEWDGSSAWARGTEGP